MCCTKRREDNVAASNQLTVLSRTLKKSVPPEIVNTARHAAWLRSVSIPASSIVPCPTCNGPNLTSYVRRSPAAKGPRLNTIALSLGAAGRGDCAGNATAAVMPGSNDDRVRNTNINRRRILIMRFLAHHGEDHRHGHHTPGSGQARESAGLWIGREMAAQPRQ